MKKSKAKNKNPDELTESEINFKIAEFCGMEVYDCHKWRDHDNRRYFTCDRCGDYLSLREYDSRDKNEPCRGTEKNYFENLNHIRLAQSYLSEKQRFIYGEYLLEEALMVSGYPSEPKLIASAVSYLSAYQKSKAFIKAIAK